MSVVQASFLNMKKSPIKIFSSITHCDTLFESSAVLVQDSSIYFDAMSNPGREEN